MNNETQTPMEETVNLGEQIQTEAPQTDSTASSAEEQSATPKKINKKLIIGAIAIILLLAIALGIVSSAASSLKVENTLVGEVYDKDGNAYMPLMNKKYTELGEDVGDATMTADRKHIVVIEESIVEDVEDVVDGIVENDGDYDLDSIVEDDGERLYFTDKNNKKQTEVAEDADDYYFVTDAGFFYTNTDGEIFKVLFKKKGESVQISELVEKDGDKSINLDDITYADETLSIAYAVDGEILVMAEKADEAKRIGEYNADDDSINLRAVTEDAKTVIYTVTSGEGEDRTTSLIVNKNGKETVLIDEIEGSLNDLTFTDDEKKIFFTVESSSEGSTSTVLYSNKIGKEALVETKFAGTISGIYTKDGEYIYGVKSSKTSNVYVKVTDAESKVDLYYVNSKGEKEKALSNVGSNCLVLNGKAYYIDEDDMMSAKLSKGKNVQSKAKELIRNVSYFSSTLDSKYFLVVKNGSYYLYKDGAKEPEKIPVEGDEVNRTFYTTDKNMLYFLIEDSDNSSTLVSYKFGKDSTKVVANDVYSDDVDSKITVEYLGRDLSVIDPDNFIYMLYDGKEAGTLTHCNGKKSKEIITDILY